MSITIDCFKAYDVRGRIPDQLNADVAYRIGNATAEYLGAKSIVLCRDIRHSSDELAAAVARGLTEAGCDGLDIGVGGTEMVYFGTSELGADGGIMVTASHNPADYNGLKMVREESKPISGDTGLEDIRRIAEGDERQVGATPGEHRNVDVADDYVRKLLSFVDTAALTDLKIVINAGNGAAGPTLDLIEPHLPFEFIKVHHEPDGDFPNGVPNPMLVETVEFFDHDHRVGALRHHATGVQIKSVLTDDQLFRPRLAGPEGFFRFLFVTSGLVKRHQFISAPR